MTDNNHEVVKLELIELLRNKGQVRVNELYEIMSADDPGKLRSALASLIESNVVEIAFTSAAFVRLIDNN